MSAGIPNTLLSYWNPEALVKNTDATCVIVSISGTLTSYPEIICNESILASSPLKENLYKHHTAYHSKFVPNRMKNEV